MKARCSAALVAAALVALPRMAAPAATIVIVNGDAAGAGFNDPTPATPVGGNTGTTLGEQRMKVFQEAARIWGGILDSDVPIQVRATFGPLECSETSGVLGAARPGGSAVGHPSFPAANTFYPAALAAKFAGVDLQTSGLDILASFNSRLDEPSCLGGVGWYYGFDNAHGDKIDLLPTVLHEMGHGLGFSGLQSYPRSSSGTTTVDTWAAFLFDPVSGKTWGEMTQTQRNLSAVSGRLHWNGPAVKAATVGFLDAAASVTVTAASDPALVKATRASDATFGARVTAVPVSGDLAAVPPGNGTVGSGCEALSADLTGKIALVDRGLCNFTVKVKNAQDAGAIGVVMVNTEDALFGMGGTDPTVVIPALLVPKPAGDALRAAAGSGTVTVSLVRDAALGFAGADAAGRAQMYAPNPFEPGSSVSHFDTSASPNLLMEPSATPDDDNDPDLTVPLFRDMGWFLTNVGVTATGPASPAAGSTASYVITVRNEGASPAPAVELRLDAATALTFVSATGDCTTLPCDLGTLAPKAMRTTTATFSVGATGTPAATISIASPANHDVRNDLAHLGKQPEVPSPPPPPKKKSGGCATVPGEAWALFGLLGLGLRPSTPARRASRRRAHARDERPGSAG